jgi:hypothetical protein
VQAGGVEGAGGRAALGRRAERGCLGPSR